MIEEGISDEVILKLSKITIVELEKIKRIK